MTIINRLIELLNSITHTFYNLYVMTRDLPFGLSVIATFFYTLSSLFAKAAWQFYYFGQWVDEVTSKVALILSFENIASHFRSFFNMAAEALEWVRQAPRNIISIVDTWWEGVKLTVWSRIDIAKEALRSRIDALGKTIGTIQEAISSLKGKIPSINEVLTWFTNWRGKVTSTIITWGALTSKEINELLASRTKELKPFWEGWQEMRDRVIELFKEPEKWLLDMLERTIAKFL